MNLSKLLGSLFRKANAPSKDNAPAMDASIEFLSRMPSFCFVAVRGDASEHAPALLIASGYTSKRGRHFRGSLPEVFEELCRLTPEDRSKDLASYKALCLTPTHTFILDRDMIICNKDAAQIALAKKMNSEVVSTIWERYSQSIQLSVYSPDKLLQRTLLVEGEPQESELVNPNHRLMEKPTVEQLMSEFAVLGLDLSVFSISREATIIETIEESR
jgi:hypothetical protein